MRKVSTGPRRGGALLALALIVALTPGLRADESNPTDPPAAVIRPPVGGNAHREPPSLVQRFFAWLAASVLALMD